MRIFTLFGAAALAGLVMATAPTAASAQPMDGMSRPQMHHRMMRHDRMMRHHERRMMHHRMMRERMMRHRMHRRMNTM